MPEASEKDKDKEKHPKTKPMPLDAVPDFADWAKKQPRPTLEDKGKMPPDPPEDTKEPREHGTREEQPEGKPT